MLAENEGGRIERSGKIVKFLQLKGNMLKKKDWVVARDGIGGRRVL
jgi:hypothetical protein